MKENLYQKKTWEGEFGEDYLNRNIYDIDILYTENYGVSKTLINNEFLKNIPKDAKILEVGTNIGIPLKHLQDIGYTNLYGIELQPRAIEYSKKNFENLNIIKADALDIPFKDNYFDLVYTHGVLIHISPANISKALQEIYRVSKSYIWGLEYYAEIYTEIEYHGEKNLLWKTNFMALFLNEFKDLKKIKEKKYTYLKDANLQDQVYLLKKIT